MNLNLYPALNVSTTIEKDEIDIAHVESEEDDSQTPLLPYEILSYPADFTLEVLVDKWQKKGIKSPTLQRKFIWPMVRASRLIESFLLGLPVPPIFVYQDADNSLLIVDGHQRLRTIAYFFSGWFVEDEEADLKVPFKLIGLNKKSPFLGADFQHLENTNPASINRLKNSVLRAFIMKQLHPADDTSIIEVFERLNTGGMVLQGQEIRNCVYEGYFNELLKRLNKNNDWRKIVGKTTEDKRMRDVELILRFLALFYNVTNYEKPMKSFLNTFMGKNRRSPVPSPDDNEAKRKVIDAKQKDFYNRMKTFENLFTQTSKNVVKYLGSKPFHIKRGLNAAVFDSVFTAFGRHPEITSNSGANEINLVKEKFQKLLKDVDYGNWIRAATTDDDVVPKRLKRAEDFLFC